MKLPFIGQSYQHAAKAVGNARTVNWYPEMPIEGTTEMMLMGAPGIDSFVDVGDGPINGIHFFDNHLWVISDDDLYRVDQNGSSILVGALEESARAIMDNNVAELFFTNGFNGYVVDPAGPTLTRITSGNFYPASYCVEIDGYGFFTRDGTTQVFNSANDDASTYGALDFLEVVKRSGSVKAVSTDGEYLWVLKELSGQVYYNAANVTGSPFSIQDGASFNIGIRAKYSMASDSEGNVYWFGSNGRFYRTEGLGFQPISHKGIEDEIASFSRTDDAYALTYTDRGHVVYAVTFPTAERTFEYRPHTGMWNDRESWTYGYWRANCATEAWHGKHYVGDTESGKVGLISSTTYTEFTDPLESYRICMHYEVDGQPYWVSDLEFVFEKAVGNTNDPGSDPECILRFSDNDGRSFFGFETARLGKKGEYDVRTIFRAPQIGGGAVRRTYRLSVKDPVQRDLTKVIGGNIETGEY